MKKLYIIYYTAGQEFDFDYEWAKREKEAETSFINKMKNNNEIDMKSDSQLGGDCYIQGIYKVPEALHKQDLAKTLDRYINKPLLNKTLITFTHTNK